MSPSYDCSQEDSLEDAHGATVPLPEKEGLGIVELNSGYHGGGIGGGPGWGGLWVLEGRGLRGLLAEHEVLPEPSLKEDMCVEEQYKGTIPSSPRPQSAGGEMPRGVRPLADETAPAPEEKKTTLGRRNGVPVLLFPNGPLNLRSTSLSSLGQ